MKNLTNLIKGLQIIQEVEPTTEFNSQNSILYIGNNDAYDDELDKLCFKINSEYECFEYNLD